MMAANIVVLFSSLLGGSFFPIEFMNASLRKITFVFPQYWLMKAIRQTPGTTYGGLPLLILLLFGVPFVVVQGAVRRRRRFA